MIMKLLMRVLILFLVPRLLPSPGQDPQLLAFSSLLCDAHNAPQMNLQQI
jgi:hypothetical protein